MIEIDQHTHRSLEFAARMSSTTPGKVVARLVEHASMPQPGSLAANRGAPREMYEIYADYDGHRTSAMYDPRTSRVDITSGPLEGTSYKTPTGAARAVVGHYKPHVSPNRNGWDFWTIDDDTGRSLRAVRAR